MNISLLSRERAFSRVPNVPHETGAPDHRLSGPPRNPGEACALFHGRFVRSRPRRGPLKSTTSRRRSEASHRERIFALLSLQFLPFSTKEILGRARYTLSIYPTFGNIDSAGSFWSLERSRSARSSMRRGGPRGWIFPNFSFRSCAPRGNILDIDSVSG